MHGAKTRRGYLYRYWSEGGTLLYVGISVNAVARMGQHRRQTWFHEIKTVTVEGFETYGEAERAELRAICYEKPLHNIRGPKLPKELGPALASLRAAQRRAERRESPKIKRMRELYTIDRAFKCVPRDMTFEAYVDLLTSFKARNRRANIMGSDRFRAFEDETRPHVT